MHSPSVRSPSVLKALRSVPSTAKQKHRPKQLFAVAFLVKNYKAVDRLMVLRPHVPWKLGQVRLNENLPLVLFSTSVEYPSYTL